MRDRIDLGRVYGAKLPFLFNRFNLMGTGATREGDKVEGTVVIYTLAGKGSQYTQVANLSDHDIFFG